jgi:hypothetical protein
LISKTKRYEHWSDNHMRELPAALWGMGKYSQFILYTAVPSKTRVGKTDKFPADFRTGRVVSAHDPAYWTDCNTAIAAAAQFGATYGVGFVFTESDPFWFIDLDNCLQADNTWSPVAMQLCQLFTGAAIEVSQSGQGLHIFGTGRPPEHGCKNATYGLEFYNSGRFVALTGNGAVGNVDADFTGVLPSLVAAYFPNEASATSGDGWTDGPREDWRGPTDDDELIRRALRSQSTSSAFGGKASFADLWSANLDALARCYPDDARAFDASSADAALAQHLAFWTGNDCERIERLMRKSALARDKWEREDYLPRTIGGAVGRQFEVLTDKQPEQVTATPAPTVTGETNKPKLVTGSTFVGNEDQLELFAGCVYIQDQHRVLIPGGTILKPEQFKVAYGGYTFTMDNANEKTTRDAWEAFTQSQAYRCPRATSACFRPDQPAGALIERDGQVFVNTYWPVDVPRKVGDATPFLTHLAKLIPNERTRTIALSYMAACVQHKGYKFQWALFIQGVQGNGKTLLTRCVAEAIGRRYVHWPMASKLTNQFNGWMVGKVFYAVEDIYVPDHRQDVMEQLKPMITGGDGLEIEGKGVDQYSADICGNFMINANKQGSIQQSNSERRYCPVFTAQQTKGDLARDGMGGDYFPNLYNWLRSGGYAIVSELLHTFPIPPEFNPAVGAGGLANVAPTTDSTQAAVAAGEGFVEQEVREAVAQGLPGFCGGWISSIMLDRLLERIGASRRMSHGKRKEMLEGLGYACHPALPDGRVNNMVLPDGGKPRLFVKDDAPAKLVTGANEAAKAYETANNHTRVPFPMVN